MRLSARDQKKGRGGKTLREQNSTVLSSIRGEEGKKNYERAFQYLLVCDSIKERGE